ncbi:MAG: cobalt-precorrin-5B (C(1))-methyltransferase [Cohaesibacter sp.]|nr:cobalt-precorrin-5B (C(1))-methyltransferase [Cohaesibacter sp.]MCV6600677.1 cobalt-precorrin-5B (C(1))-methyltransferase [Cohaesibacter sp.]
MPQNRKNLPLKRGWTTGACATAATKAALTALIDGEFPDPVQITLPKGQEPAFPLAMEALSEEAGDKFACAGIVKDAGDDPDVTHGAIIKSEVRFGPKGQGILFKAGKGVGTVTKPGLPIEVGEAAINPVPRHLMSMVVSEICAAHNLAPDVTITISIPTGEQLAKKTWNPRLGILGGLSILGTTGIVVPFSCAAWIHSIHRGIDVARASNQTHVAGCTGSTSEKTVRTLYDLPESAMLDMGDFVGGMLKYLRRNPVQRVTIGGGFAKLCKLAQGHMDLHSGRSQVDFDWLAEQMIDLDAPNDLVASTREANTALAVLRMAQAASPALPIAEHVAKLAHMKALSMLKGADIHLDVIAIGRGGDMLAHFDPKHNPNSPPQERR